MVALVFDKKIEKSSIYNKCSIGFQLQQYTEGKNMNKILISLSIFWQNYKKTLYCEWWVETHNFWFGKTMIKFFWKPQITFLLLLIFTTFFIPEYVCAETVTKKSLEKVVKKAVQSIIIVVQSGEGCKEVTKRAGHPLSQNECIRLAEKFQRAVEWSNPAVSVVSHLIAPVTYAGEAWVWNKKSGWVIPKEIDAYTQEEKCPVFVSYKTGQVEENLLCTSGSEFLFYPLYRYTPDMTWKNDVQMM